MLDTILCYTEWSDKEKGGNDTLLTVLSDKERACRVMPCVQQTEGDDGIWNSMCAFIAKRNEHGNPQDALEMINSLTRSPLPYLCAYCLDEVFNLIVFVRTTEKSYKATCEYILRDYYRHVATKKKDALHFESLPYDVEVELSENRISEIVSEEIVFESEKGLETELPKRTYFTPESIVSNNLIHSPSSESKESYKNIVSLSTADELASVTRNEKKDIFATDGVSRVRVAHAKKMRDLSIQMHKEPDMQKGHFFPDMNNGNIVKRTDRNVTWFIENCLCLDGVTDTMQKTEYLVDRTTGHRFYGTSAELQLISSFIERYTGWSDTARVNRCVAYMIASNPIHPFKNAIPNWDHEDHIGNLCETIHLADAWNPCHLIKLPNGKPMTPKQYVRAIMESWLRCTIKRVDHHIFQTSHNDYPINIVPIFQGPQGCYKNTWIKRLCFVKGMYQEKGYISPWSKDDAAIFLSCVVCHLDEIDSNTLRYYDLANLKQLITKSTFDYRAPYDRRPAQYVNQCSFIGSTNKEQFFVDESGSRRFFVIQVKDLDIVTSVNIPQVWAQALWEVEHGYPHYVPMAIERASISSNRMLTDFGIAPALVSCFEKADKRTADRRFTSIESMYFIAHEAVFGRKADKIGAKNKASFRKLLQQILGMETNLSNSMISVRQKIGRPVKVYPFRMKGSNYGLDISTYIAG